MKMWMGNESTQVVNITPGFTSPVTDWLTIIIGVTPDIYAKNTEKGSCYYNCFYFSFSRAIYFLTVRQLWTISFLGMS